MKVTVIGSGTMGNGIAHVFAQYGHSVSLLDVSQDALDKGMVNIKKNLDRQLVKGTITDIVKQSTLSNIETFTDIQKAVISSDLVIEAATENLETKLKLFSTLDELCKKETILASNTSSISITKLGNATHRPDKVIGMHFMNPVPLLKLVEVIKGKDTSSETAQAIMDLSVQLEKIPVLVNDAPGFVANRILMPMINEAIFTLHEGVSGVQEIDTVMKLGMAHPMGPLQLADYIGLDVCLAILNVLHSGFGTEKYEPCPLLIDLVNKNQLGVKSGFGFYMYTQFTKELVVAPRFVN